MYNWLQWKLLYVYLLANIVTLLLQMKQSISTIDNLVNTYSVLRILLYITTILPQITIGLV